MSVKLSWFLTDSEVQEAKKDVAPEIVESEKRMTVVKAWEEYRKARAESRASQKLAALVLWENQKRASLEAKMKMKEQNLEKEAAQQAEKLKNQIPMIQKKAKDKRISLESRKGKYIHKVEKVAEKFRADGHAPKRPFGF